MSSNTDEVLYRYSAARAREAYIPGVPARDLTRADVARLQPHERRSVEASAFYTKVEQPAAEASKTKKEAS